MDSDYMSVHGSRVWGEKRASGRYEGVDPPEKVAVCLNCPYPEPGDCARCRLICGIGQVKKSNQEKREQFRALYRKGLTDAEIAREMEVTVSAVRIRRRKLRLPMNRKEEVTTDV